MKEYIVTVDNKEINIESNNDKYIEDSSLNVIKQILDKTEEKNQVVSLKSIEEYFKFEKEKLKYQEEVNNQFLCQYFTKNSLYSFLGGLLSGCLLSYLFGRYCG